ncbi:MAG: hypothetical protein U1E76_18160 [Planctomycetota bacterium]
MIAAHVLLLGPLMSANLVEVRSQCRRPGERSGVRPLMAILRSQHQADDVIYVGRKTVAAYRYYSLGNSGPAMVMVTSGPRTLGDTLRRRPSREVWFLCTISNDLAEDERGMVLAWLDAHGRRLGDWDARPSHLYRYEVSRGG